MSEAIKGPSGSSNNLGDKELKVAFKIFSDESEKMKRRCYEMEIELNRAKEHLLQLEKELQEKERERVIVSSYMNHVLKKISQGVIFVNMQGKILSINKQAEKLLSLNSSSLLLKKYEDHFPDDYFGFSMQDALHYGLHQPLTTIQKQGKEIEVESHFMLEGPSSYQGVVLFLQDQSERSKLTDKLKHKEALKELGEMTSMVAHEIKNPLGGIRGYAMLLESELEDPSLKEMAKEIREGTKSLDKLLSKILSHARPLEFHIETKEIASFMRKQIRLVRNDPEMTKDISIELHLSEEPFFVPIDEELIKQALLNLMINSFHAMKNGGKLTICLMKEGVNALITLSDTGEGIEEKNLSQIFSPFFTTKSKGHGLGLSQVHKIIHGHLGTIDVRSERGHGTTFTIKLPLKRAYD